MGAGVVGCAVALALARRGAAVVVVEAERAPGLQASGTNSGILHSGFDSIPGELETRTILRSAELRAHVLEILRVPIVRCGALMRGAPGELIENARANGVEVRPGVDGTLEVPGESICDPVAFTIALAEAAERHGATLLGGFRVVAIERSGEGLAVTGEGGEQVTCRAVVNCAGLRADEVARAAGDDSFEIYPRKGEFLVFESTLDRILLPVPTKRTKGVLVFPTIDGHVAAGPTAIDIEDKDDWSVRPEARDEIVPKATAMWPPLANAEETGAYAGLRPAGRGVNYLIGPSAACPGLVNVAAIRSTGLTASLGIAEYVCGFVGGLGSERPLSPAPGPAVAGSWWRRTAAEYAA